MRIRKDGGDAPGWHLLIGDSLTRSSINARSGFRPSFAVCDSSCHIFINVPADAQVNRPLAKIVSRQSDLLATSIATWDLQSRLPVDKHKRASTVRLCLATHIERHLSLVISPTLFHSKEWVIRGKQILGRHFRRFQIRSGSWTKFQRGLKK